MRCLFIVPFSGNSYRVTDLRSWVSSFTSILFLSFFSFSQSDVSWCKLSKRFRHQNAQSHELCIHISQCQPSLTLTCLTSPRKPISSANALRLRLLGRASLLWQMPALGRSYIGPRWAEHPSITTSWGICTACRKERGFRNNFYVHSTQAGLLSLTSGLKFQNSKGDPSDVNLWGTQNNRKGQVHAKTRKLRPRKLPARPPAVAPPKNQ